MAGVFLYLSNVLDNAEPHFANNLVRILQLPVIATK
jgi:hypothetical protein